MKPTSTCSSTPISLVTIDRCAPQPPAEPEDAYLLAQIKAGDPVAIEIFYDRYASCVYSSAMRVIRDVPAAEDIVQEVFLTIWRRPELLSATGQSLTGWMLTVGRNRAVDVIRANKRRQAVSVEDVAVASPHDYGKRVEHQLMGERASLIISELPTDTRIMIEMAFFQGMTHIEIANQLGVPLGSVKSKIRNGLLSVRQTIARPRKTGVAA